MLWLCVLAALALQFRPASAARKTLRRHHRGQPYDVDHSLGWVRPHDLHDHRRLPQLQEASGRAPDAEISVGVLAAKVRLFAGSRQALLTRGASNWTRRQLETSSSHFWSELAADYAQVRAAFLGRDVGMFASMPQVAAGWCFTVSLLCYFLKVLGLDLAEAVKHKQKRQNLHKAQQKFHHGPVHDMMGQLTTLQQSLAGQAEHLFQEKHREILKFLHNVARNKFLDRSSSILTEPFREFMALWLSVFEQCSVSPERNPFILCPAEKLQRASSVATIAKAIGQEGVQRTPTLAGPDILAASALHKEITRDKQEQGKARAMTSSRSARSAGPGKTEPWLSAICGVTISWTRRDAAEAFPYDISICCLHVSLLSFCHAVLLLALFVGLGLAMLLHGSRKHFTGLCVDFATFLVMVLLYYSRALSENARLDDELARLTAQMRGVEESGSKLAKWAGKYEQVCWLWQYQTANLLDLFSVTSSAIEFPKSGHAWHDVEKSLRGTLRVLSEKLKVTIAGMGPVSIYMGDSSFIRHGWWTEVNQQIRRSIGLIGEAADLGEMEQVEKHLDNFFGLLVVRVMGARKLPNTDEGMIFDRGNLTDPFVIVRLGNLKREAAPSTAIVSDSLNPRWEEEFCLMVRDESCLTLEVFDENEGNWLAASRQGIGFVRVHFRHAPGQWVAKEEHLRTLTYGKQMEATLEYEVFFASCVRHLLLMEHEDEERVTELESLGAWLAKA